MAVHILAVIHHVILTFWSWKPIAWARISTKRPKKTKSSVWHRSGCCSRQKRDSPYLLISTKLCRRKISKHRRPKRQTKATNNSKCRMRRCCRALAAATQICPSMRRWCRIQDRRWRSALIVVVRLLFHIKMHLISWMCVRRRKQDCFWTAAM